MFRFDFFKKYRKKKEETGGLPEEKRLKKNSILLSDNFILDEDLLSTCNGNVILAAPAGSGKVLDVLGPNIEKGNCSMIIIDNYGAYGMFCAGKSEEELGFKVMIMDLTKEYNMYTVSEFLTNAIHQRTLLFIQHLYICGNYTKPELTDFINKLYNSIFEYRLEYPIGIKRAHIQVWLNDFKFYPMVTKQFGYQKVHIENFEEMLAIQRQYNIGTTIVLHSLEDLKKLYPRNYGGIITNCSTLASLGFSDINSANNFLKTAEGLAGKRSIYEASDIQYIFSRKIFIWNANKGFMLHDKINYVKGDE